jgi:PhnB protein
MRVEPYLFFEGKAEEAINFYRKVVDAKDVQIMRYKDSPEPGHCPTADTNKIMHAAIHIGETLVMLSDGNCTGQPKFDGIALSLSVKTDADADRYFANLSEGANVILPITKTFFSSRFGMLKDKFGVMWMIIVMK